MACLERSAEGPVSAQSRAEPARRRHGKQSHTQILKLEKHGRTMEYSIQILMHMRECVCSMCTYMLYLKGI